MPIQTAIWRVSSHPVALEEATLPSERLLEDMIVAAPRLLSEEWMLIGRQIDTGFGGRLDLLAIAPDASLVLIEIKRERTPRDVVAQAVDYASWVQTLEADDVASLYRRYASDRDLGQDFRERFGQPLDEDEINHSHQIILVASSLDASNERIVAYLSTRDIPINVLCFQVFRHEDELLLSRSWLLDPIQIQASAAGRDGGKEPWNGEFYVSFGHGSERFWDDAVEYGLISGGGGSWYSRTLQLLEPEDRIWVKIPGLGFVGVGRVIGRVQPAEDFEVETPEGKAPIVSVTSRASYLKEQINDPEQCEYFVPVQWLQTVSVEDAVQEIGMFGNQNTVCKPTTPKWRATVARLKEIFPSHGD